MKRLSVFIHDEDAERVIKFLTGLYDVPNFGAAVREMIAEKLQQRKQKMLKPVEIGKGRLKQTAQSDIVRGQKKRRLVAV